MAKKTLTTKNLRVWLEEGFFYRLKQQMHAHGDIQTGENLTEQEYEKIGLRADVLTDKVLSWVKAKDDMKTT